MRLFSLCGRLVLFLARVRDVRAHVFAQRQPEPRFAAVGNSYVRGPWISVLS